MLSILQGDTTMVLDAAAAYIKQMHETLTDLKDQNRSNMPSMRPIELSTCNSGEKTFEAAAGTARGLQQHALHPQLKMDDDMSKCGAAVRSDLAAARDKVGQMASRPPAFHTCEYGLTLMPIAKAQTLLRAVNFVRGSSSA